MSATPYEYIILAIIVFGTLVPSMVIGSLTANSIKGWYSDLKKPKWNPPNWIFGPVWTVLYISMAVAVWLVWKSDPGYTFAFQLYIGQLLLNHLWSPMFFLFKKPGLAFINIILLWVAILITTILFALKVTVAGQLMIPYLLWVSFASCLNYRLWQDNRT